MASANYKASPPFFFLSTQQQVAMLLLSLCLALMLPFITGTNHTTRGCIEAERDALLSFKAEITYHKVDDPISSWGNQTDDCCQWAGVRCDNDSGHVLSLNLQRMPPPEYDDDFIHFCSERCGFEWGLSGNISESLIGLRHLKYFDLSFNCFQSISIPKLLGSLENLVHLDLSYACFTGVIPDELGNLTKLRNLNLSSDEGLKVNGAEWLSGLSSLRYLSIDGANFSGVNNVMQSLNKLHYLKLVSLFDCRMNRIPESFPNLNFSYLTFMDIGWNNFHNTCIPEWLFKIPNLRHLSMTDSGLIGNIPSSIGNATSLQFLDLSSNEGISGDMPRGFGDLCNLQSLHLDGTFMGKRLEDFRDAFSGCIRQSLNVLSFQFSSLKGPLPDWLGELRNLTFLDISSNPFNSSIPASIGKLSQLQKLYLYSSALNGFIPESLGRLSSLQHLDLHDNTLNGSIPQSLGRLSSLQYLDLHDNTLNGSIPQSLGRLSSLQYLDLSDNNFNYSVITEAHLANLTSLGYLSLNHFVLNISTNWIPVFQAYEIHLSYCHIGPKFPVWLANQVNLAVLDISNTRIKDLMPDWFWNITETMAILDVSNNEIKGRLPQRLKSQDEGYDLSILLGSNSFEGSVPYFSPDVYALDLSNNQISGNIPSDLGIFDGRTPQLNYLFLSSNNLSGIIPNSICDLVGLVLLELSNNHLEGAIPNCWNNLTSLRYLILANNSLAGEVPNSLISSSQSLEVLHLSNNQLRGKFPSFLKKCTFMTTLALDHNSLSGEIPSWVGKTMTSLMILTLKENNFSGNLPLLSNLTSLHFLDISHNSFVGFIPKSYGSLMGMINVSMNGGASFPSNTQEGLIIKILVYIKGIELQFGVTLSSLKFLDLSANNLLGQIPKEIVNLVGLQNLDLSCNNLSGEIPIDIGRMQSLESLDLSRNELIGAIPPSLSTLHFLGSLNLSYNNLSGKIPYASQLTTFNDPSIYAGNLNLCGAPLSKNCTSEESPSNSHVDDQEDDDDNDNPTIWFGIGLMSGFVVGFLIVLITLLFKNEWRYAYFRFMDHMYDMMYVKIVITINKIKRALAVMS
ncbi:receptor-like protein EIX2 [Dioscorea cayenensis subsp. rotundata]|uniref:Receptor-like protein EIX2 n=1 Tax=Dioscorea cayennensis subsp. rotundata TaxID=55577 RepID=A0AB40CBM0_DIOCR|nr:receptor-like protein EIX2 [Dioscorea cayenensis subsp. rotundata]